MTGPIRDDGETASTDDAGRSDDGEGDERQNDACDRADADRQERGEAQDDGNPPEHVGGGTDPPDHQGGGTDPPDHQGGGTDPPDHQGEGDGGTGRRRFLAAASALASTSLAGCDGLPSDGPGTTAGGADGESTTDGKGPGGRRDSGRPAVYAIDPAPVVEGRDGTVTAVFHDVAHRRVDAGGDETSVPSHAVTYGHDGADGPPRDPWTAPRMTVGVLSTPATVGDGAGENPLATLPVAELLATDAGAPFRRTVGLGSEVDWAATPTEVDAGPATALDSDATMRTFVGVVGNRAAEPEARGAAAPQRFGLVTVHALRVEVDGTAVLLGMATGWETQSLDPDDVDEANEADGGGFGAAARAAHEDAQSMLDDSGDSLTKTGDGEDGLDWEPPPEPEREDVTVPLSAASRGLLPDARQELGYPDETESALENTTVYVEGRDQIGDILNWDDGSFDRGTEYHLDVETVTRSYTVDGERGFPFGVVTAPRAYRHGAERNALASAPLADLLTSTSFEEGLLEAAMEELELYDDAHGVTWETEPTPITSGTPTIGSADAVAEFEGSVSHVLRNDSTRDVEVHVVRWVGSDVVTIALLANVTTGDEYWDDRANAREVFQEATANITAGPASFDGLDDVGLSHLSLVQTVADTTVQDPSGSDVHYRADDVDLVADEHVAPLFDLTVPSQKPHHAVVEFDVAGRSDTVRTRFEDSGTLDWFDTNPNAKPAARFHQNAGGGRNDHPVFRIDTDTSSVTGTVRAPSGHAYPPTDRVEQGSDYAVAEVEPLRVGFVTISDNAMPRIRERYGGSSGLPSSYEKTVQMAVQYLRRAYPGKLYAYEHPIGGALLGKRPWLQVGIHSGKVMLDDMRNAHTLLQVASQQGLALGNGEIHAFGGSRSDAIDAIEDHGFHATVAVVPDGYFEWYGNTFDYGGITGITPPFKNSASAVREFDSWPNTMGPNYHCAQVTAHELGHKFVADPYDEPNGPIEMGTPMEDTDYPMAARNPQGTDVDVTFERTGNDVVSDHARNWNSDFYDDTPVDEPAVASHGYDLTDGTFRAVEGYQFTPPSGGGTDWDFSVQALDDGRSNGLDRIESYMSYSRIDTWADEHLHQQLIHDGWSRVTLGQWVFSATGSVDDEGDLSFPSVRALREQPYEDAGVDDVGQDDGAVHVRLVAPDGETLVDRTVAASHHVHDAGQVDGLVSVDVPFPLETARFEATRDGATTTLNPVVRPIRDALERVPDRVLDGDPEEVRARFEADLDAVASLMADGDYATAAERVTELRTPLAGVVPASYEAALNQPTSEELLDLTGRMRERLDALAAYGGESSGGNCTPGHTAGDPPCKQVADDAEVLTTYDPSGSILPVSVRYPCGWDTDATEQFDDYAQVNASRSGFGGSVDVQVRAHYEPVAAGFLAAKTEDGDYDQVEYEYAGEPRTGLVSAASTASLGTLAYAVVPVQGERVLVELVSEMTPDTCDMETRPDWGLVKEMLRSLEPAAETTFEPATTGQAVVNEVDGFAVRYHAGEPRTDSYAVLASIENTGGQTTEITNYDVSVRLYDADGTAVHSAGIVVWNASGELAPGEQRQITVEDTLQDGVAPEDVARYELRLTCGGHADGVYCDS